MVTVYELACELVNSPNIGNFVKSKLVDQKIIDFKTIYEFYCSEKTRVRHSEAITFTGEEYGLSDGMIWKIKYMMESLI